MSSNEATIRIEWKNWFEVGHTRIDAEHRTFFDIIKSIDGDVQAGADKMRVLRSLNELALYTQFHFASEENLMEDVQYADISTHRDIHKHILAEMHEFIGDIRAGINRIDELIAFLFNWFCSHTVSEDIKLAKCLSAACHSRSSAP